MDTWLIPANADLELGVVCPLLAPQRISVVVLDMSTIGVRQT
jgi:hypothetical protein